VAVDVPDDAPDRRRGSTAADPFDSREFAALMAPPPGAELTRSIARAPERRPARPSSPTRSSGATAVGRPGRPRRSRRGPALLALALVLALTAGLGAWWLGYARYTSTPGVLGLAQPAAVQRIEAAGLGVEVGDKAYSETVPAGRVIDTDPDAGARILDDGTVTVTLSLGKERYDVPRTRGLTEDQAQDALIGTKLGFGRSIGRYSETVPEGTVMGSDPRAGTTLRPETAVDLILSKGPRPIRVRDWTGQDADNAEKAFDAKGLEVQRRSEYSDSVPEGDVISQSPADGTLFRGDSVALVVSRGPELVEVPGGLIASGVEAATEELEALGFEVEVEQADEYIGLGFVFSTDPDSGSMVPKGSTITLNLI
jgi:serine/threonine-protein kinase